MYIRHETGKIGEKIAEQYLIKQGYTILDKNFYSLQGEIDIIAKEKKEIVIIEVKTRTNKKYGNPAEAVDYRKQKHMYNTAKYYLYKTNHENEPVRFDIIEVLLENDKAKVNHIKKVM